jgi:hypothetical protein
MQTPTPFRRNHLSIIGGDRTIVADLNKPTGDTTNTAFNDGDFIVRACNNHERLVSLLQRYVDADVGIYDKLTDVAKQALIEATSK